MNRIVTAVTFFAAVMLPAFAFAETLPGRISGVPGPIAGAGLPIIVIGYGAYRLIHRLRRKTN
jgi:hypothetical protein